MDYVIQCADKYYVGGDSSRARFGSWNEAALYSYAEATETIETLRKEGYQCVRVNWDLIKGY
ncbi:hypothetical protein [Jeotgalibacillus terrae]|uniref:Uncharacterized protein n=1 Tax=Jeotgalibacillus terrae TaxID=587735 RepID=A0ABW5ZM49_9BACL|nr:hypothetical protein [Jeotgalibacillus terrae]MBM7581084.1 hypothetical protein [Jeotgalibacillus terrae]